MNSNINHYWIVNLQSQCLELQYFEYEIYFPCYVLLDYVGSPDISLMILEDLSMN